MSNLHFAVEKKTETNPMKVQRNHTRTLSMSDACFDGYMREKFVPVSLGGCINI